LREYLYVVVKGNVPQETVENIVSEISECYEKLDAKLEFCEVLIFRSRYEADKFIDEENERIYSKIGIRISEIGPESSATHFAWRGWPTIAVCVSDMENRPWEVAVAELRRAIAHSILHGSPEYYFISLPQNLLILKKEEVIRPDILDLAFYMLTTAVKSFEVTRFLVNKGFIECQQKLYRYHLRIRPGEKEIWKKAENEINLLVPLLMDVFKVLSGVTPLIKTTEDPVLRSLYEENLALIPKNVEKSFKRMLTKLLELGGDTLKNIADMADEFYGLLKNLLI